MFARIWRPRVWRPCGVPFGSATAPFLATRPAKRQIVWPPWHRPAKLGGGAGAGCGETAQSSPDLCV